MIERARRLPAGPARALHEPRDLAVDGRARGRDRGDPLPPRLRRIPAVDLHVRHVVDDDPQAGQFPEEAGDLGEARRGGVEVQLEVEPGTLVQRQ